MFILFVSCIIGVPVEIFPGVEVILQRYLKLGLPKIFTILINIDLPGVHLILPKNGMSEHLQVPFLVKTVFISLWIAKPLFHTIVVGLRISKLDFV